MFNYLKTILLSLLICMMPYMNSTSKAVGNEEENSSTSTHYTCKTMSVGEDDQNGASSSTNLSPSLKEERLEEPQRSWTSYASSTVKSVAQNAYYVLDYATRNPKNSIVIGLFMASQVLTVDAKCACYCFNPGCSCTKFFGFCAANNTECIYPCAKLGLTAMYCIDKDKGC